MFSREKDSADVILRKKCEYTSGKKGKSKRKKREKKKKKWKVERQCWGYGFGGFGRIRNYLHIRIRIRIRNDILDPDSNPDKDRSYVLLSYKNFPTV
jgi:hypothetical protein